jgi:branched-chain amino acid transport system substrate-binding protein
VYLVGYNEMVSIYKQAKELGLTCQWLGNNQLNDQSLIDKMGTTADGTIFPGHDFVLEKVKADHPEFYNKYIELSKGVELDVFAAYGADAMIVINQALLQGAKTGKEIKTFLYNAKTFKGLLGYFSFDSNGDAIRNLGLYKIQNGKILKHTI